MCSRAHLRQRMMERTGGGTHGHGCRPAMDRRYRNVAAGSAVDGGATGASDSSGLAVPRARDRCNRAAPADGGHSAGRRRQGCSSSSAKGWSGCLDARAAMADDPFLDLRDRAAGQRDRTGACSGWRSIRTTSPTGELFAYYTDTEGTASSPSSRCRADPNRADAETGEGACSSCRSRPDSSGHPPLRRRRAASAQTATCMCRSETAPMAATRARNPTSMLATIVRLDVDGGDPYAIPADNPFVGGGGAAEVWAYGLRNPWRFAIDHEERPAVRRRRRPGEMGGSQRRTPRHRRRDELRLVHDGGRPLLLARGLRHDRAHAAGAGVRPRRRLLDHGRIRLSGECDPRARRPLLLRRLVRPVGAELPLRGRGRDGCSGIGRTSWSRPARSTALAWMASASCTSPISRASCTRSFPSTECGSR